MLPAIARKIGQSWDTAQRFVQRIGLKRGAQLARRVLDEPAAPSEHSFADWQKETLHHLIARMCHDPSGELPAPDEIGAVEVATDFIAKMPPARRAQLRHILCVFEAAPLLMGADGERKRFSDLSPKAQDAAISDWADSAIPQQRAVFQGLKSVCMMGFWSQPGTWPHIGFSLEENPGVPSHVQETQ